MVKKLDIEEVRREFTSRGYTPLFDKYTNNSTPLPFMCDKGHKHKIELKSLRKGLGCAVCSGVARITLEQARKVFLAAGYLPLFDEYKNSHQRLLYQCDKGHKNKVTLSSFKSGVRCPSCAGNKKVTLEEAQQDFIDIGYIPLFKKYENNSKPLPFKCDKGHKFKISLQSLRAGRRCYICFGNSKKTVAEMKQNFLDVGYVPLFEEYKNNKDKLKFKCDKGHEHCITWSNFQKGQKCYRCSSAGVSKSEKELVDLFKSKGIYLKENNKDLIAPYELDIYFPEQKLAVEYCGLYWHSEASGGKDRNYHHLKRSLCEEKEIRLITIFEDEYLNKPEVIYSRISSALGIINNKIYARKCEVRVIDKKEAKKFLDEYHLQGYGRSKIAFGLFYGNLLVGVMTGCSLSRSHVSRSRTLELKRLCFLPGYLVVGGASKLFKKFVGFSKSNNYQAIRSYQDMRWGNPFNPIYDKLGFEKISETKYTPHYVSDNYKARIRNQSLRKTPEERLTKKTEWELRQQQGYDRIWDCGHRTYEIKIM